MQSSVDRNGGPLSGGEEAFRAFLDHAPIGIAYHRMVYDATGRPVDYFFIEANRAYKELTGVDPVGKLVTEAFPGIDKDPFDWVGTFAEVVGTGVEKRFKQHLELNDRWYDFVAYRTGPGHFVVAFNEITEHKRAEADLERERGMLRSVMETSPVGIATTDAMGAITYANRRAEEILGLSKAGITSRSYNAPGWHATDLEGKPFPDERQPFMIVRRTLAPAYDVRHAIEWPDGRRVVLSVNARPVLDAWGGFAGMVATFEDITERQAAEERIRSMLLEKELILKETHHRIKNNMNLVASLLSLEAMAQDDKACRDSLESAAERVQGMMALYDRLYRPETPGDQSLAEVLPPLLGEIVSMASFGKRLSLVTEIAGTRLPAKTIVTIGIILNELVTNTAKYAFPGRGGGSVTVSAVEGDGELIVSYSDDGVGLPESITFTESSGFGMQLIGVLAQQLRARLSIERGRGTTIRLACPLP